GVPVQSVLTANGLGWSSIIYPGQTIAIPPAEPAPAAPEPEIELVAATTPAPEAAPPAAVSNYTIQSGDTISAIAARFGLSTQAVLDANGLAPSSIIYPGRTLVIPAPSSGGGTSGGVGSGVTILTAEQEGNARI